MKHLHALSRQPMPALGTDVLEQVVLLVLAIFFSDWDNYPAVSQNLQKFFAKT